MRGGQTVTREGAGETQTETAPGVRQTRRDGEGGTEGKHWEKEAEERAKRKVQEGGCTVQASKGQEERREREGKGGHVKRGRVVQRQKQKWVCYCRGGRHWPGPAPGPSAATAGWGPLRRKRWPGHRAWRRVGCGSCGGGLGDGWETEDSPCSPGQPDPGPGWGRGVPPAYRTQPHSTEHRACLACS